MGDRKVDWTTAGFDSDWGLTVRQTAVRDEASRRDTVVDPLEVASGLTERHRSAIA